MSHASGSVRRTRRRSRTWRGVTQARSLQDLSYPATGQADRLGDLTTTLTLVVHGHDRLVPQPAELELRTSQQLEHRGGSLGAPMWKAHRASRAHGSDQSQRESALHVWAGGHVRSLGGDLVGRRVVITKSP